MAANTVGVFCDGLQKRIQNAKVLVVGMGGIGCELLKNLVLTGFQDIEVIDLDTIDVSNLNRQFLFNKQHVGKSKAKIARESVIKFNPKAKIVAHHDTVISNDYGVNFFKKFTLVLNALDNRAARNHVNRMCLAADIPLVESGTSGYSGQVELIMKGRTKCYECDPKPPLKSYPGCTIRNTPSEPIHCIVWAKHLFNQLFGEADPDEDVSPDTADPEAAGEAGERALSASASGTGNIERVSTRSWSEGVSYNPQKIFTKLFTDDVKYLLNMDKLWKSRRPPEPLFWEKLPDAMEGSSMTEAIGMRDQRLWSIAECADIFSNSLKGLKQEKESLPEASHLTWDKDHRHSMDFVAAAANLRAFIFGIPLKSKFDVKSMAGNIIPAIATSNAIVAGLVVMHAMNILQGDVEKCQTVYLRFKPNHKGKLIVPERKLIPPDPKCRVCSKTPQVALCTNLDKMTCKELETLVLKNHLNMAAPDVILSNGSIVISSEEGETDHNNCKTLRELGIVDGSVLVADDFLQKYKLRLIVTHREMLKDEPEFLIAGDLDELKPQEEEESGVKNGQEAEDAEDDVLLIDMASDDVPFKKRKIDEDVIMKQEAEDDVLLVDTVSNDVPLKKRKINEEISTLSKKRRE